MATPPPLTRCRGPTAPPSRPMCRSPAAHRVGQVWAQVGTGVRGLGGKVGLPRSHNTTEPLACATKVWICAGISKDTVGE
eukprot:33539-Chlamydomonas_euryale.AAC.3